MKAFIVTLLLSCFVILLDTQETIAAYLGKYQIIGVEEQILHNARINTKQSAKHVAVELAHFLEQKGYILATVKVANKKKLIVDLGRVTRVKIIGLSRLAKKRADLYLQAAIKGPPQIKKFDRALALINDLPGISASMAFERNPADGNYELVISAQQYLQTGGVVLDYIPRNLFDQRRLSLHQSFHSIATGGDILRLQGVFVNGGGEPDQKSFYASYQAPLGNDGTYAEVSFGDIETHTSVRGRPTLVLTGTGFSIIPGAVTNHNFIGQTASFVLGHPIKRNHSGGTYILGSFDYSTDRTGSVGEIDTWAGDLSLYHIYNDPSGYSVAAGLSVGGGYTNSYIDNDDGQFSHLHAGLGIIKPLPWIARNTELRLEAYGQIATEHTPTSKIISLGGINFMRGYPSSVYTGTSGLSGSVELAHAYDIRSRHISRITPYLFTDFGYVSNPSSKQNTTTRPDQNGLLSAGIGTRIDLPINMRLDTYVAAPLMNDYTNNVPSAAGYLKLTFGW